MACVTSCPSGVQYDRLIEETRHVVEAEHRRPRAERLQRRLLFATLPYPRRMRWALRLAPLGRALPAPALGPADARPRSPLALGERPAAVTPSFDSTRAPARRAPDGLRPVGRLRRRQRGDRAGARRRGATRSSRRARDAAGALGPRGPCGESQRFTERLRRSFDGVETIVVNASGCGSHLKERGLPAIDLTEALADADLPPLHPLDAHRRLPGLVPPAPRARLPAAWKPLLERIPGLESSSPPSRTCAAAPPASTTSPGRGRPRPR